MAKNITEMRDRQEVDHTTRGEEITGSNYLPPEKVTDEHSSNDQANS